MLANQNGVIYCNINMAIDILIDLSPDRSDPKITPLPNFCKVYFGLAIILESLHTGSFGSKCFHWTNWVNRTPGYVFVSFTK
jgi:hypothetical protein